MLIQIEGNECSGKTTLINNLSKLISEDDYLSKFTYRWLHLPSKQSTFGRICRRILHGDSSYLKEAHNTDEVISKELVITLCAFLDQYIVNNRLDKEVIQIESRGILSNLVYSNLTSSELSDNFTQCVLPLITLLPKPDLIIYLKCDSLTLKYRLENRCEPKSLYDKSNLLDVINTRYDKVIKLFPSWVIQIIDSNLLSSEECSNIALNLIKNTVQNTL